MEQKYTMITPAVYRLIHNAKIDCFCLNHLGLDDRVQSKSFREQEQELVTNSNMIPSWLSFVARTSGQGSVIQLPLPQVLQNSIKTQATAH